MKWIGQNIWSFISRFRSDVYLESISSGTIASGSNLGLDSNNKIVKATIASGSGDLTAIIAGTGLSGTDLTGPIPTLNVDASQTQITSVGTIATGVWNGDAITTSYIADEAIVEAKLESGLLNTIEANAAKTGITSGQASAITANTAKNTSSNVYGSTIKLIPSDFETNGDGGNTKFGAAFDKTAGEADYGMRTSDSAQEVFAFVSIPEGMKATHVEIYGRRDKAVEVFEVQINATTVVSKGTGTCGIPSQAIGDEDIILSGGGVTSTATNLLAIEVVTIAATADRIYGGTVTIAAI
jgi:hypothetical protein